MCAFIGRSEQFNLAPRLEAEQFRHLDRLSSLQGPHPAQQSQEFAATADNIRPVSFIQGLEQVGDHPRIRSAEDRLRMNYIRQGLRIGRDRSLFASSAIASPNRKDSVNAASSSVRT